MAKAVHLGTLMKTESRSVARFFHYMVKTIFFLYVGVGKPEKAGGMVAVIKVYVV